MEPFEMRGNGLLLDQVGGRDLEADLGAIVSYCQDPATQRWTTVPVPYTRTDALAFATEVIPAGWLSGREFVWAVRQEGSARLLGTAGVRVRDPGTLELAYLIAPEARGRGICERACRLILHRALDPAGFGADRAVWVAAVGNWASWRVAWKLGFRREGTLRSEVVIRGRRYDGWIGTLLPGDQRAPAAPWDGPERW